MKTNKQELKKLYAKSKNTLDNFAETLEFHLSDTLDCLGFKVTCFSECINLGTKRKPKQTTLTTVILERGLEKYMTQRVNALIDYTFSPEITEIGLFDIIYNRV